jgi:hypothetical protein
LSLKFSNWELENIYDYEATAAQDITNSGTDLCTGSKTITIPANKDAKIVLLPVCQLEQQLTLVIMELH